MRAALPLLLLAEPLVEGVYPPIRLAALEEGVLLVGVSLTVV